MTWGRKLSYPLFVSKTPFLIKGLNGCPEFANHDWFLFSVSFGLMPAWR